MKETTHWQHKQMQTNKKQVNTHERNNTLAKQTNASQQKPNKNK